MTQTGTPDTRRRSHPGAAHRAAASRSEYAGRVPPGCERVAAATVGPAARAARDRRGGRKWATQ